MREPKHPVVFLRELVRSREGQPDLVVPVDLGLLRELRARLDLRIEVPDA